MKRLYYTFLLLIVLSCVKQPDALDIPSITPGKDDSQEEYLPSVTGRLSDDMFYSTVFGKNTTSVSQNFEIDFKNNLVYMCQVTGNYQLNMGWTTPEVSGSTRTAEHYMTFNYMTHGASMRVERDGDESYVWLGNYGTKGSDGEYDCEQVISRIRIVDKAVVKPSDISDNYFFGYDCSKYALDFDSDRLLIYSESDKTCRVYSLKELRSITPKQVTINRIVWGGAGPQATEVTESPVIMARDCRTVSPQLTFSVDRSGYQYQSIMLHGDRFYMFMQTKPSGYPVTFKSFLLIFDLDGRKVKTVGIPLAEERDVLISKGLMRASDVYFEPEGIKFYDGRMFLMWTCHDDKGSRRPVIMRFKDEF